jgi:hypothetical protein
MVGDHYYDRDAALRERDFALAYSIPGDHDAKSIRLASNEIIKYPYADGDKVGLTVRATARIIDTLRQASSFTIRSYVPSQSTEDILKGGYISPVIFASVDEIDREKFDGLVQSCH